MAGLIEIGDVFTVEGLYHRRTFWECLLRRPKRLKQFRVIGSVTEKAADKESREIKGYGSGW